MKSFKDMSQNEFSAMKKRVLFGSDDFTKEPQFSRQEYLTEDTWIDYVTPKRKKADQENISLNYFKSNEEIKKQIAWQLQEEKEARENNKITKNISWNKLQQSKLFLNAH